MHRRSFCLLLKGSSLVKRTCETKRRHLSVSIGKYSRRKKDPSSLSSKEEESILFNINSLSKEQLEKTGILSPVLDEMMSYRSQHGPFLSLGDVLSLPGMENSSFKAICQHLKSQEKRSNVTFRDPELFRYFSPALTVELMDRVQSVTSLEVCLDSVCFASASREGHMTDSEGHHVAGYEGHVTDWDSVALLGSNHIKQTPDQVLEQALHVVQNVPKADVYLLETRTIRKVTQQYLNVLLFISRLQTAIHTLLAAERLSQTDQHSLFMVKDAFVSRIFDLRVGGERISGQQVLQEMENGECQSKMAVPSHMWQQFHGLKMDIQKERYSNCLLMVAGFLHFLGPGQPKTISQ